MKFFIVQLTLIFNFAYAASSDECHVFKQNIHELVINEESFDVAAFERCSSQSLIPNSDYYLGLVYIHGINVQKDFYKGISYLIDSSNNGNLRALATLGEVYIIDNDEDIFLKGVKLLKLAMENGDNDSIITLFKLMNSERIPFSRVIKNAFDGLINNNDSKAVIVKLELAIVDAIKGDSAIFIEEAISQIQIAELDNETKGKVFYLIARAFITGGTSFYSIPRVKRELENAAQVGHA